MVTIKRPLDKAMDFVLRWEGGYSNDPRDPGGATNHGISIRFLQKGSIFLDLDKDGDMDANDIRLLDLTQAKALYEVHFWDKMKCAHMPDAMAVAVMDTGVNMGVSVAAKFLQRVLGVEADGVIGPQTLTALANVNDLRGRIVAYHQRRMKRYTELSGFATFGVGWLNRLIDCQDYCTGILLEG